MSSRTLVAALAVALSTAAPAPADIVLSQLTYRTGPYASGGIPLSDGFADYVTLLNERDGGINGQRISIVECEYGYDTQRGVECYEETLAKGALYYQPNSTGLTLALIERAHEDGVVLHTTGYGLTAASDGETYPWIFNFPAHYWDAASAQIRYLKEKSGGSLQGKTVMHLHHNSGYGREPIQTLELLAEREGFDLLLQPIDHPGEDQSALWPEIAEINPDYILLWGWGVMNPTAYKGARSIEYPMERMVGVWWSAAEEDLKRLGKDAHGYKAVTFHDVGTAYAVYNEMNDLVYFAGKARGQMNNIGTVLYNRGVVNAIYATEAVRKAMEIHNTTDITRAMLRDGFEALEIDAERYTALGMDGFTPPIQVSCQDHGGGGQVAIKQWDAGRRVWDIITDYYQPDDDLIEPQITQVAASFAADKAIEPQSCR